MAYALECSYCYSFFWLKVRIRKQAISEFQVLARPGFSCLESLVNVEHREVNLGSLRRDRSIRVSRMCVGSL
jgi:hypothetical protein